MTTSAGTALVTGAGGTLGRQIVLALQDQMASLALTDLDAGRADRVASEVRGCETVVLAGDVANPGFAAELVGAVIERFGSIDVLINGAGIEGPVAAVEDLEPGEVEQVFAVNVMSIFWLCSAIVPSFKERGSGRIVNIASGAGLERRGLHQSLQRLQACRRRSNEIAGTGVGAIRNSGQRRVSRLRGVADARQDRGRAGSGDWRAVRLCRDRSHGSPGRPG